MLQTTPDLYVNTNSEIMMDNTVIVTFNTKQMFSMLLRFDKWTLETPPPFCNSSLLTL